MAIGSGSSDSKPVQDKTPPVLRQDYISGAAGMPQAQIPLQSRPLSSNKTTGVDASPSKNTETKESTSTDSNIRYAAYATRIRTILLSAHRYVAYTSDIGESFRPVAHPYLVRGAYGVSWLYILGDVSNEGYKAYWRNQRTLNPQLRLTPYQQKATGLPAEGNLTARPGYVPPIDDWRTVMVQRGIFQSVASMGLPAFTIHSVVRYSGRAMKNVKNATIRTWAPIGLGLAVVPFLPTLFDKPVEEAVDWAFHKGFQLLEGKQSRQEAASDGRSGPPGTGPSPKAKED